MLLKGSAAFCLGDNTQESGHRQLPALPGFSTFSGCVKSAGGVEQLVSSPDCKSGAFGYVGSSPTPPTISYLAASAHGRIGVIRGGRFRWRPACVGVGESSHSAPDETFHVE